MNRLEQRYRRVLRLLPADYRHAWADDMVAALLESMATDDPDEAEFLADHGRPGHGEVASVLALAVRLRLGGRPAAPRSLAWGAAVRLAVLMATLTAAVFATVSIVVAVWVSGRLGWLPAPPAGDLPAPAGLWRTAWALLGNAWLPAYVALVCGQRRVAQAVALLAVLPAAAAAAAAQFSGAEPVSATPWAMLLVDLAVIGGMAAFRADTPPARRPWLLALPAGVLLIGVPLFAGQLTGGYWVYLDWPGVCCVLVTAAMLGHLAALAGRRFPLPAAWTLALALLAGVCAALRLVTLLDQYARVAAGDELLAVGSVQLLVVLALGLPLAVRAGRGLRRLPPAAPGTGPVR